MGIGDSILPEYHSGDEVDEIELYKYLILFIVSKAGLTKISK